METNAINHRKLPIGIENFKVMASECYYVDKTLMLKKLSDGPIGTSYLFTRPRRFGKSLILSMIQTFFEKGKNPSPYFKETQIYKEGKQYLSLMGSFPVIHLNLKDLIADNYKDFLTRIRMIFEAEKERLRPLLDNLPLQEKEKLNRILGNDTSLPFYLSELMSSLSKACNQKVIVLIDEYDTPLEEAYQYGYYDECVSFFRKMYGSAFKGNSSLRFSVLVGVLLTEKEKLFPDLNHLVMNSVTDRGFDECFGFTEEETKKLLNYYGYSSKAETVKSLYEGYHFGDALVYNPWSILCYIQNQGQIGTYWGATGGNPFSGKYLLSVKDIKSLLNGSPILKKLSANVSLKDIAKKRTAVYSLLLNTGYLTARNTDTFSKYLLTLPNEEIKFLLRYGILQRYSSNKIEWISQYREILQSEDEERVGEFLKEKIISIYSSYDFQDESDYQSLLLGFMAVLCDDYIVQDEFVPAEQRADIVLIPKDKKHYGFIYELKHRKGKASKKILKTVSMNALKQIEDKHYDEAFHKSGIKSYTLYGVAFAYKSIETTSKKVTK